MTNLFDVFFCTGACKKVGRQKKHAAVLKCAVLGGVAFLFCINVAGVVFYALFYKTSGVIAVSGIYAYSFVLTAVNYFMTAFLEPGDPAYCHKQLSRTCSCCHTPKPMRTHHCSICDRCVVKMDHHCPWIQQCVGFNNYGQFIALMAWSSFTMLFSFVCILVFFVLAFTYRGLWPLSGAFQLAYLVVSCVSLAITAIFGFVIIKLFLFHVAMMAQNKTTIEYHEILQRMKLKGDYENPYDQGWRENLRQIIPYPWRIFVPFARIRGDFDPYFSYDHERGRDLELQFAFYDAPTSSRYPTQVPAALLMPENHEFVSQPMILTEI